MTSAPVPPKPDHQGRLEQHLRHRRAEGRKLLVPYLMGGMTDDWTTVLEALADAGADAVEVGIPFSDPMMDGPVIQEASVKALALGTTPAAVLDGIKRAEIPVPVVVMTYYNLIYRAGHRRAANDMAAAGVSGALLPDLTLEEIGDWAAEADPAGVETVLLVAPSSPPERVGKIAARCRGFVYAVARMGVTGERSDLDASVQRTVGRVQAVTDTPVLAGVGVSTPAQAVQVSTSADGAIVGSALVRRLLEGGGAGGAAELVGAFRQALDAG